MHEMRTYLDSLFRQMTESSTPFLLPAAEEPVKMLPAPGNIPYVDILNGNEDLVIRAYPGTGIGKKDISIELINPRALRITWVYRNLLTGETDDYYQYERISGSSTRTVALPYPVVEKGSAASLRNGVLEIHLGKAPRITGAKITVD
jgi:HSP20 family molecular chaperone IbpA